MPRWPKKNWLNSVLARRPPTPHAARVTYAGCIFPQKFIPSRTAKTASACRLHPQINTLRRTVLLVRTHAWSSVHVCLGFSHPVPGRRRLQSMRYILTLETLEHRGHAQHTCHRSRQHAVCIISVHGVVKNNFYTPSRVTVGRTCHNTVNSACHLTTCDRREQPQRPASLVLWLYSCAM